MSPVGVSFTSFIIVAPFSNKKILNSIMESTIQGKVPDDKENILNRNFNASTINQKWVTDITYIYVLSEGWTYLASVMDLYDRKIIGYSYGKNMTTELAKNAVENACRNVEDTKDIILHCDLSCQYTSTTFEKAQLALFEYIESWYTRKRRHSALDHKTPQQVEDEALVA